MMETRMNTYLIISAHCLKNIDGSGTIKYYDEYVICKQPLVTRPFSDHTPMFFFHDKLMTDRELTSRMIMNNLNRIRYNSQNPVNIDEVFFAVHNDGILCCWFDKTLRIWRIDEWDDIFTSDYLTEKQAGKIADQMKSFYKAYMNDPRNVRSLQREYLDFVYC